MNDATNDAGSEENSLLIKLLDKLEWLGNKLPDPAVLFIIVIIVVWGRSDHRWAQVLDTNMSCSK